MVAALALSCLMLISGCHGLLPIRNGGSCQSPFATRYFSRTRSIDTSPFGIAVSVSTSEKRETETADASVVNVKQTKKRRNLMWDDMYPRLKAYYEEHGHREDPKDKELVNWVRWIRSSYRHQVTKGANTTFSNGKSRGKLSLKRLDELQAINFQWYPAKRMIIQRPWHVMFPRIQAYYSEHGHTDVQREQDPELSKWVKTIRSAHKHQVEPDKGPLSEFGNPRRKLSQEKLDDLKSVNFMWHPPRKWDEMYMRLKAFYKEHGHSKVTRKDDPELKEWCSTVQCYFRGKMDDIEALPKEARKRYDYLQAVEFPWRKPSGHDWVIMYPKLQAFYEEHGHSDVPVDHEDKELAKWVARTSSRYRFMVNGDSPYFSSGRERQPICPEKFEALQALQFPWEARRTPSLTTDQYLDRLKRYRKEHKDGHVREKLDPRLYRWIANIRCRHRHQLESNTAELTGKQSFLSEEEMQKLNDADFPWYPPPRRRRTKKG